MWKMEKDVKEKDKENKMIKIGIKRGERGEWSMTTTVE